MKKKIVILGGGESGYGSAYLAMTKGFEVFLSDKAQLKTSYRELLIKAGISFEEGTHTMERILDADEIIKSPGLPENTNIMRMVREKGISVVSEIEFAKRYTEAKCLCITGSNGKTTTTSLLYDMLQRAGFNVGLGGNIGKSFAYQVATENYDWYVLELSSFQLDDMFDFQAYISLLTNITPDHLDRYDYDFSKYVASKFRVTRNQLLTEYFVYNADDVQTMHYLEEYVSQAVTKVPITAKEKQGCCYDRETEAFSLDISGEQVAFDFRERLCGGVHNAYNYSQAVTAALLSGVPKETVQESIRLFKGPEHRMEHVGTFDGVRYINDSKATNVDAAWYALESVKNSTVWIAGGTDKGNDYSLLYDVIGNVHTLICMGVDNSSLESAFSGRIENIVSTHSFDEAMETMNRVTRSGDVVLLSPACASFDLFLNYENRGSMFKEYVTVSYKNK